MKSKSDGDLIGEIPGFSLLTEEETLAVRDASYLVSYRAGEVLFRQGTPVAHVMYVTSGLIKVFREERNDRVIIFDLVTQGSFIGLLTVLGGELYQYSAVAVDNAQVMLISLPLLMKVNRENGEFASIILNQSCQEGLTIMAKLMNQFHKQLPGRVADMLLFFSEKIYGSPIFDLPLSRRELAEFTGTTKESMIRTLAEFRHDKIINLDGKRVEIISPDIIHTLSRLG